jgi:CRP-like cAMP-binding protein
MSSGSPRRHSTMAPRFDLRRTTLAPGLERPFDEDEWRDALVVVESGEIEISCQDGGCRRFVRGDVLFFEGLRLRSLANRRQEPVVLVSVSRAGARGPSP